MEEIENFYWTLDNAKAQCVSQEIRIVLEDLNAKVGKERNGEIVNKIGLGNRNECEEKWVQWCTANDQIAKTQEHPRRI